MMLRGHVKNGMIVLDQPAKLPEGAAVQVQLVEASTDSDVESRSLYERLQPIIGTLEGLPKDAAKNLDHYLYGHPKQQ